MNEEEILEMHNKVEKQIERELEIILQAQLEILNEVIHQSTVNLKSAGAVAQWAIIRKQQLTQEESI